MCVCVCVCVCVFPEPKRADPDAEDGLNYSARLQRCHAVSDDDIESEDGSVWDVLFDVSSVACTPRDRMIHIHSKYKRFPYISGVILL